MQHQKAKHFKCNQCPRRLNTAGGLAVHIQQVHKLDPDQCVHMSIYFTHYNFYYRLPRIENALPGRDGYEVEIFGMEGIPAPDVADYKRRKEQELGLPAGSISGSGKGLPQNKRPRIENRVLSEDELRAQLQAHRALMGGGDAAPAPTPAHGGAVYNAAPQTYATPPVPQNAPPFPPGMMPPPGAGPFPGGPPPPGFPGQPPFPPFPPGAGFPPGSVGGFIDSTAASGLLTTLLQASSPRISLSSSRPSAPRPGPPTSWSACSSFPSRWRPAVAPWRLGSSWLYPATWSAFCSWYTHHPPPSRSRECHPYPANPGPERIHSAAPSSYATTA